MTDLLLISTTSASAPKGGSLRVLGRFLGGLEHNGTDGQTDRATYVLLGLLLELIMEGEGCKSQAQEILFFTG